MDINRVSANALEAARRPCGDGVTAPELADGARNASGTAGRPAAERQAAKKPDDARGGATASSPVAGDAARDAAAARSRVEPSPSPGLGSRDARDTARGSRRCVSASGGRSGKWDAALPLPPAYERLADVFVALQQVGPLLRKRQQACTADIVCASVETMTGRRCSLSMLRSVEAVQPGTVSFGARGGGSAFDPENGPTSPRRVRADVVDPDAAEPSTLGTRRPRRDETHARHAHEGTVGRGRLGGSTQDAKGVSARRFRAALVALVGAYHDAFCAEEASAAVPETRGSGDAHADVAPVTVDGVVVAWHARFDLATVPDPPPEASRGGAAVPRVRAGGEPPGPPGADASDASDARAAATGARTADTGAVTGNGSAVPDAWHRGHAKDTADAKARVVASVPVARAEAAAAAAELGAAGRELPLAAVAAVMKRKRAADHDADPATLAERRRRRLCDLLPGTFDTVRSLFATSKKKVSPFAELLERVARATAKKNASRDETEAALRLLAEASPEWCALMPARTTVSGEELFRIKTSDAAVTRFVRQKLVAMKEDKL